MKRLVVVFFFPLFCCAQGVKLVRYDAFVKKQRVEMEPVSLLSTPAAKISVTFSAVGADLFVLFSGAGWGAVTVDEGNELLFRFANDSTVSLTADGLQTFEPGVPQSTYRHRYRIRPEGVEALARNELASLRKYSFKEAADLRLPKEAGSKLQKQSAAFLAELKKASSLVPLKRIAAKDVLAHVGDSVQFCSKVYNVRSTSATEEKVTVLNLQANYSEPIVNLLIPDEDVAKFGASGEAAFANKEVCVSGLLLMQNNVPTIILHRKEQLKLPAAATDNKQ